MNTKNTYFDLKKIPRHLFLTLFTAGASLILGLLSFGGMYALLPILPLAFGTFFLSVIYEAEIYLQNIKGTLKKLFKNNYLENHLAEEYLAEHFPKNTADADCPKFFKDYEKQLHLLATFGDKVLTADAQKQKKQIEKTLKDMGKWFALQLFPNDEAQESIPAYAQSLRDWLAQRQQTQWQEQLTKRRTSFRWVAGFSTLAALFMSLGSTYLIVEAFSVIPWFVAIPFTVWPLIIVPMALIAGTAYGLLTYNTVTDLINNDTINKWYNNFREIKKTGWSLRNAAAISLVFLAAALTLCTAGTWWTVATSARPLFDWMKKMPSFIMGALNPIITGLSAISFQLENISETLEMVDEATSEKTNPHQHPESPSNKSITQTENWLQILNPFRILLKLTITPLQVLLFIGHLVSIALTSDRMPGMPQIVAVLIGMISEGFEDAHYFFEHAHKHDEAQDTQTLLKNYLDTKSGHDHETNIPLILLKAIASPIYALAAIWDYGTSKLNSNHTLSWSQAWNKQRGNKEAEDIRLPADLALYPSDEWKVEHAISLIKKHEKHHLRTVVVGADVAAQKIEKLQALRKEIRHPEGKTLATILAAAQDTPEYNRHRMFAQAGDKAETQEFIEALPLRVQAG